MWGRDRERGTTALLLFHMHPTGAAKCSQPLFSSPCMGREPRVRCFVATPLPQGAHKGGREPWGTHLRTSCSQGNEERRRFQRVGRNVGPTERTGRLASPSGCAPLSGAATSVGGGVTGPATAGAALPFAAGAELAFGGGRIGRPCASVCGCDNARARSSFTWMSPRSMG